MEHIALHTRFRQPQPVEERVGQGSTLDVGIRIYIRHSRARIDVAQLAEGHPGRDGAEATAALSCAGRHHAKPSARDEEDLPSRITGTHHHPSSLSPHPSDLRTNPPHSLLPHRPNPPL